LNRITKIIFNKGKFLIGLLFIIHSNKAQDLLFSNKNFGFNIGGNFAFGTHFQRIGINFNFFYVNDFVQANSEVRTYFNLKNLGPKKIYREIVLSQGIVFGYGYRQNVFNPFINSISNQTGYPYSFAYAYNGYFNPRRKIKTTQQTGIIGFQFNSVSVIIENDILARPMLDRFRTGAFLIQYQYKDIFQAAVNCTMWTGAMGRSIRTDTCFPSVGYMDTTNGTHSNYSHGLLSAQFKYHMGLSQTAQTNIGVDAEQVRNFVQNKCIHDVFFIPKKWFKRYNCHIPMLDEKCEQYLYKSGQKIKKPELYWNVFSNPNLFY